MGTPVAEPFATGWPQPVGVAVERTNYRRGAGRLPGGLTLAGGDHDGEPFAVLPWELSGSAGARSRYRGRLP